MSSSGAGRGSTANIDLDIDAPRESEVLEALDGLGYRVETDWRPNRVELTGDRGGYVDVHPLRLEPDGTARQVDLDGGWHVWSADWFTAGTLDGRTISCVSAHAQRLFRTGCELRASDLHDLRQLDIIGP